MRTITQIAKSLGGTISKNSPQILTGMAVAGLASTTIMGIRATPKAMALMDEAVWDKYEEAMSNTREDLSFEEWMDKENGYDWKDRANTLSKKEYYSPRTDEDILISDAQYDKYLSELIFLEKESYFWVCQKCGKDNQDTKVCECGNKHYTVHDIWPIIDKPIKEAYKEYLSNK